MLFILISLLFIGEFWKSAEKSFTNGNKKLVMIYFHMDNCSFCKKMDKKIWNDKDIQTEISKKFDPVEMNISDFSKRYKINNKTYTAAELSKVLKIRSYPSVLFMDKQGNVKYYLNEYVEKKTFLKLIATIN